MSDNQGVVCGSCGTGLPAGAKFCAVCGSSVGAVEAGGGHSHVAEGSVPWWKSRLLLVGSAVMAGVLVVGVAFAISGGGSAAGGYLLLGEPQRGDSGLFDLYLVSAGDEATNDDRIARDVSPRSITVRDGGFQAKGDPSALAVLPSGEVALRYFDDESGVVMIGDASNWEETSWEFDTGDGLGVSFELGTDVLTILEYRDSGTRCYLFGPGADADQRARSDGCGISPTDDLLFTWDDAGDSARDVTFSDLEGNVSYAAAAVSFRYTKDRVFLVEESRSSLEFVAVEWRSGTELARSRRYDFIQVLDVAGNAAAFIGNDLEGSVDLLVVNGAGEIRDVTDGTWARASLSEDGRWLFYAVFDEDGDWEMYALDIDAEASNPIDLGLDGSGAEDLAFGSPVTGSAAPVLIVQVYDGAETEIYVGTPGGGIEKQFDAAVWSGQLSVHYTDSRLYFSGLGEEPAYIYDVATGLLIEVEERWDNAWWMAVSDQGGALLEVEDGNDRILYHVSPGEAPVLIELDGADDIGVAVFSPDGKTVWYTAEDRGDLEVRTVTVTDDPEVETVYEDTRLFGAAWQTRFPRFIDLTTLDEAD